MKSNLRKAIIFAAALVLIATLSGCSKNEEQEIDYGQEPPGVTPEVFAPGIISRDEDMEYACTFSPDGSEIYYSVREGKTGMPKVYMSTFLDGAWHEPCEIEYDEEGILFEPHYANDGMTMYFTGRVNDSISGEYKTGIWKRTYQNGQWTGLNYVNAGMYVSTTDDGTIYMTDIETNLGIVKVIEKNGDFSEFTALEGGVNEPVPGIHPCIAPDESFIIYDCNRDDGYGGEGDLYVSFNNGDGTWSEGFNLGPDVNSEGVEFTASFSPDGKYIFFMKDYDLYWVDAQIIEQFRP